MERRFIDPLQPAGPAAIRVCALITLLAFSLALPRLAAGQEDGPELTVDPADERLVIHGMLDDQTTSFSGNVRLTVTGGDVEELRVLADDLQHGGDETFAIDRTHVTVPAGLSLDAGQPRDVRVTVHNVTRPGDYTGELKFLLPDQEESEALVIPLEMHIDARPAVEPIRETLTFQLVRCNGLGCGLAALLLPDSVVRNERVVQLDNQTRVPVRITDAAVVLRGERTGEAVRASDVSVNVPRTLVEDQIGAVDVIFYRNRIPSDSYQGSIRLKIEDADDPVTVGVDLDVRDGPVWPLLVAVFGILVGRLIQGMQTPEAKLQMELLPRFYELRAAAAALRHPAASAYVADRLREVKRTLDAGDATEEELVRELDQLDARIEFLASLDALERELEKLGRDALEAELAPKIGSARQALIDGRTEEAEELRGEVEARLRQAQRDGTMGGPVADLFASVLERSRDSAARLREADARTVPARPGGQRWAWLARLMAALSGARAIRADVRYWLIRPLLWFVLLVVLVLLGLQTLYVNGGASFGAAGIYDYLGIFLWGLSADVAQRTLQDLQASQASQASGQG